MTFQDNGRGFLHWPTILQFATLLAILSIPALGVYVTIAVKQATIETSMADFVKAAAAEAAAVNFRMTQDEDRVKELDQDERAALADLRAKMDRVTDSINEVQRSLPPARR